MVMKKGIILMFIILLCSGCSLFPNNKCMGEYEDKIISSNLTFKGNYAVCANPRKKPIFKNNEKAMNQIKEDYAETLDIIKETFKLKNFKETNLEDYKKYSNQLTATSEETKKEAANLSILLEIYQNGKTK